MKFLKKYWWLLILIVLFILATRHRRLLCLGFKCASSPMPEALAALESDELVTVETEPWLIFTPTESTPTTGFIFYPGGKVDYRSYAPQARAIAEAGYLVIIPEMPLNLAVFNANAANDIITAYPDIENWAIGGHSLGGAMAAKYVYDNPDTMNGLVLWASYPAGSNDLVRY